MTQYSYQAVSAHEAVKHIQSNHRVFVHGAAATPNTLLKALTEDVARLSNVELIHLHTEGPALYADSKFSKNFKVANLFVGENMRGKLNGDNIDYLPCFLSEMPSLFRSKKRALDVALVQVSPPDLHGYCTLGTSVDAARAAVDMAPILIGQINQQMPRVHGDGMIHISEFDAFIEVSEPIATSHPTQVNEIELAIGKHVAGIIEDGSCLQVGIGSIPDAVLKSLKHHKHLGVHTEMWSDGILELIKTGVIDNSLKSVHPGKTVSAFLKGSQAVYDFINDNPTVILLGSDYVNNPNVICRNKKAVAINSAVEIDLTGQVCADSIGHKIISGVGGQMDFMRGASQSEDGKPVIAITSRTKKGISRIVPTLNSGAGVVTTRSHIHYVATEYGIVDLFGKTLSERAQALIKIAHPEDREKLTYEWKKVGY